LTYRPQTGIASFMLAFLVCMLLFGQDALARPDPSKPNRLAGETSLYLREHADNPVDWYPWGEEAFEKARRENKPILLSIGYATCLYCHVMEQESYSNETIASLLNEHFVAIKVDREQRPDIDETFILATQLFSGASGWPNNVFLTPDLKPFFGGLYFPPVQFIDVLTQVSDSWQANRNAVVAEADRAVDLIHQVMRHRRAARTVNGAALSEATGQLLAGFDRDNGGFGSGPKFTQEFLLLLLLDRAELFDDTAALHAATATLDAMVTGGVRDHVGGGFHRYAIDPAWTVPNLEIMLFNQAGMARALLQAYRLTGKETYADAVRHLLDFVVRDMTAPEGGFYTSLDPELDRNGGFSRDGLHYTWTDAAFEQALAPDDLAFAERIFDLTPANEFAGRNILTMKGSLEKLAEDEGLTVATLRARLRSIREALRLARGYRPAPRRDEKILSGWNGMMILAIAEAAIVFDEPSYRDAAIEAAEFVWSTMGGATGTLKRSHFDGKASVEATQPDFAFVALACLSLYDATEDDIWLERAKALASTMNAQFFDAARNDYFLNGADSFYRPKMIADTEQPSGNAAAIELFSRLMRRDGDPAHQAMAEKILASISGDILESPRENVYALRAAAQFLERETSSVRMAARGRVRVEARETKNKTVIVAVSMAPGWHVNSDRPNEEFFIPTKLTFPDLPENADAILRYPEPRTLTLRFHNKPLSLFEERFEITTEAFPSNSVPKVAQLTLQACSDTICLEPETLSVPVLR